MWRLLLLSALTGLVLADSKEGHGHLDIDPRLRANAARIINLERKLDSLKKKLDDAEKIDPEGFIKELDARVTEVEGTHCGDKQFQCGGNEQECISDLLVCDHRKDCHNGHDEEPSVCDPSPAKAGHIFSGTSHWTDCLIRHDHVSRIVITGSIRFKDFPARIWVSANFESDLLVGNHTEESSFKAKGYYDFGHRRLALFPTKEFDNHYSVVCEFNHGDAERADCHRVQEDTLHECADLHVTLQGHH